MKKSMAVVFMFIFVILSGCNKENGNDRANGDKTGDKDEKITGETRKTVLLEDVGGIYSINEKIEVQLMGNNGFIPGYCTLTDVRVTKKFEEDASEWRFASKSEEEKINNGYSLIYIDAIVENSSDEDMDYYVSCIKPIIYFEGELAILSEIGYCSDKGTGKSVYQKELKAGEKIEFTVGYIMEDKYIENYDMYIDVSGKGMNPGCLLVETDISKGDIDD